MRKETELIEKIQAWAKTRGLYDKGTPQTQLLKLVEEIGELYSAITLDEQRDAVGDAQVVMINLLTLLDYNIDEIEEAVYATNSLVNKFVLLGSMSEMLLKPKKFDKQKFLDRSKLLIGSLHQWEVVSRFSTLEDAYKVIANRKGTMVNGNFVKEE